MKKQSDVQWLTDRFCNQHVMRGMELFDTTATYYRKESRRLLAALKRRGYRKVTKPKKGR